MGALFHAPVSEI